VGWYLQDPRRAVCVDCTKSWWWLRGRQNEARSLACVPQSPKAEADVVDTAERTRIITGVLIGDFFHNLSDGFFLGAAFAGCGTSFGWKVATGTILHEIAQELADYAVLTSSEVGLKPIVALGLNFLSGTGVLLGAMIILAGEVSNGVTGLLLAFGGGVYIHIAATECMPRVYAKGLSFPSRIAALAAFFVGAICIGLVLLDHEHCVPDSADAQDAHAGHGH